MRKPRLPSAVKVILNDWNEFINDDEREERVEAYKFSDDEGFNSANDEPIFDAKEKQGIKYLKNM